MASSLVMRFKVWWKAAYARVTLNRFTLSFFVFSFIYCFFQGIAQSLLFTVDFQYSDLVSQLVKIGGVPVDRNMTFLQSSTPGHLNLQLCYDIPHGQPVYPCISMYDSTVNNPRFSGKVTSEELPSVVSFGNWMDGIIITPVIPSTNISTVVPIRVITPDGTSVTLSRECVRNLLYPYQILLNLRREDIAWICLQFWLLAISFNAILNNSVPHILAVLMTRALATAWAMYAIWRGPYFKGNFHEILADPGTPCSLDLFDAFWARRQGFEIADLILSSTSLLFFIPISLTLLKHYSAQSFRVVGAPARVMRLHKFFMAVLACLQMEAFVLVTAMGLWVDVLVNTYVARFSEHTTVYEALIVATTVLLIPWIAMGWYSIRREMRRLMVVYLAIGFSLLSGWAIMFYSIVYRWSFLQWPYLGCFTVAALVLLIASMALGVVCRVNFGKGLAEYLHAESALESLNFAPDSFDDDKSSVKSDFEKGSRSDYDWTSNFQEFKRDSGVVAPQDAVTPIDRTPTYDVPKYNRTDRNSLNSLNSIYDWPSPKSNSPNRTSQSFSPNHVSNAFSPKRTSTFLSAYRNSKILSGHRNSTLNDDRSKALNDDADKSNDDRDFIDFDEPKEPVMLYFSTRRGERGDFW